MIFSMEKYQAKDHDADYNELMQITAGLAMMSWAIICFNDLHFLNMVITTDLHLLN